MEDARGDYTRARDAYLASLGKLTEYFKQAEFWRQPFGTVEWVAVHRFGEPAKHALAYAYKQAGLKEASATGPPSLLQAVDYSTAPYTLIADAIKKAEDLLVATKKKAALDRQSDEVVKEAFDPFAPAPDENSQEYVPGSILSGANDGRSSAKKASFLTNMAAVGIGSKLKSFGDSNPASEEVESLTAKLNDPAHLQELKQIQTRAMLSDMLQNDEVISGYDPEEVLTAFNEISQLSPRAASQPMVARPLLRKRLTQGGMEPYEAEQIASLEKTVGQTQGDIGVPKTSQVIHGSPLLQKS